MKYILILLISFAFGQVDKVTANKINTDEITTDEIDASIIEWDDEKKRFFVPKKTERISMIDSVGILTVFDKDGQDSLMCVERGHVSGDMVLKTLMYCSPYIEETDSTTYLVYPACNWESYTCLRCGKYITELEKEVRMLIWKKERENNVL